MLKGNQAKCPNCCKFVEYGADGYYDREWPYHETAQTVQYCDEVCSSMQREIDKDANQVGAVTETNDD